MSGEMEAASLTVGQPKGRDGRIHTVSAREFILLACERSPGSEENYYGDNR